MQHNTAQITSKGATPKSTSAAQITERKKPARALSPIVAEECVYRWVYARQRMRDISRGLRIHDRDLVEDAILNRLKSGPLTPPGLRSVA
jgi:hypothetical protein